MEQFKKVFPGLPAQFWEWAAQHNEVHYQQTSPDGHALHWELRTLSRADQFDIYPWGEQLVRVLIDTAFNQQVMLMHTSFTQHPHSDSMTGLPTPGVSVVPASKAGPNTLRWTGPEKLAEQEAKNMIEMTSVFPKSEYTFDVYEYNHTKSVHSTKHTCGGEWLAHIDTYDCLVFDETLSPVVTPTFVHRFRFARA